MLCGNKSDLLELTNDYVQDEAADKIASEHQMKYFKTSAFKGDGIDEMMEYTIEQLY
jgi:selenocysteine-specific translation elongation factor